MKLSLLITALLVTGTCSLETASAGPIDYSIVAGTWQAKAPGGGAATLQLFAPNHRIGNLPAGTMLFNGGPGRFRFNQTSPASGILFIETPNGINFNATVSLLPGQRMQFQMGLDSVIFVKVAVPMIVAPGLDQWLVGNPGPPNPIPGGFPGGQIPGGQVPGGTQTKPSTPKSKEAEILKALFEGIEKLTK